jgi:predicted metal-dependent peptidase
MKAQERFDKAKVALLLDQPFFGSLLLNLKCKADPTRKTMATDGISLLWSPKFVERLTQDEIKTILAHEVMHCAMMHHLRRGNRDNKQWNVATDHAINLFLDGCNTAAQGKSTPPFPFPAGALKDPLYAGMSAEAIYAMLPQPTPSGGGGGPGQGQGQGQPDLNAPPDNDPGGMGEVMDAPGANDPAAADEQEGKWKVAIAQAEVMAKSRGNMPGAAQRLVQETLHPAQDWVTILRRFIRDNCKDDYSWVKPNPRYISSGFMLPSLHSQKLGRVVVAIDTSGSIDNDALAKFMTELEAVCHECRPSEITVYACDEEIQSVTTYEPTDVLPKHFDGGGGTSFRPVFEAVNKGDAPVALLYFTDLDGPFPDAEPGYPVLWAVTGSTEQVPFGDVIKID